MNAILAQTAKRYWLYLSLCLATPFLIPLIFRSFDSVLKASLVATAFFWFVSSVILICELVYRSWSLSFWGALQFLCFAVFPITWIRTATLFSGVFETTKFLGLSGSTWHSFSKYSLLLLILLVLIEVVWQQLQFRFFQRK
jgi:hypothetical protein